MPTKKDLTGQKLSYLYVIGQSKKRTDQKIYWFCECTLCGSLTCMRGNDLKTGQVQSCGCLKKKDLTGIRFGKLVVVKRRRYKNKNYKSLWWAVCDCGNMTVAASNSLIRGNTKSCGCYHKETHVTHGHKSQKYNRSSQAYTAWQNMKNRCENPKNKSYSYYGAKGIRVCERWKHNFETFLFDMEEPPSSKHTLERIDPKRGYNPANCTWETWNRQCINKDRKGYYWESRSQRYRAKIKVGQKEIYLGSFTCPEEARKAYIKAKKYYHNVYLNE